MPESVTQIADEARVLLNDVGVQLYTDAVLLGPIKKAYDELQKKLNLNGIQTTKEVSAIQEIAVGTVKITSSEITDLVQPLQLWERPNNSTDVFQEMDEKDWEPETLLTDELRYWVWRENEIKFLGANTAREVKVRYIKSLPTLSSGSSTVAIIGAKQYLAARAAAIAAATIGNNSDKATIIQADANIALEDFLGLEVKSNQSLPVRRRPFRRN